MKTTIFVFGKGAVGEEVGRDREGEAYGQRDKEGAVMLAVFGSALILLSSLYAILSTVMGTCTMGSADELVVGGLVAAVGYGVGMALLIARPPNAVGWVLLSPVVAVVAYQAYLAGSFFIAYHVHSLSACAWKQGIPEFDPDGREPWLTALWVGVSAFGLAGFAVAWLRGQR